MARDQQMSAVQREALPSSGTESADDDDDDAIPTEVNRLTEPLFTMILSVL